MGRVPPKTWRFLAGALLLTAAVITVLLTRRVPHARNVAAETGSNRLAALAANVNSSQVSITVSATLLNQLMEEDVVGHAAVLQRIRNMKGNDAAAQAEALIRAPYRARLRQLTE